MIESINDLDARIKSHADDTLQQSYHDYQKMLVERIHCEQALAEIRLKGGNWSGAR